MFIKYISQKTHLTLIIFFVLFNVTFLFAQEKKRILFISSYHPTFPTFFKQIDGVKSILKDVQVDVEFMDSKRFNYDEANIMFAKKLKWKLKSLPKYDAIITSDDNALIFLLKHKNLFFPNIPTVFLGVNDLDMALQQNKNPFVTGVVEAVSMFDTLKLMNKLHTYTDKIIAITDGTLSGKADLNKYKKLSEKFQNKKLEYISLKDYNFDEFWKKLSQIDKKTPVLLLSAYLDKNGNRINFNDSLLKIKQHLNAPLYHLWFHGMEEGILGGKLISHYYQGESAGKIVSDILNGKNISEINVKADSPNKYFFDYAQMKKFDIEISKLPKESIILNKPISLYNENKILIWSIVSFIIFLLMIILIILINILKRKEVEKKLKLANTSLEEKKKELETIIEEAPNPIIVHQEDGNIIMLNQAWINSSGYSLEETPTIDDWVDTIYENTESKTFVRKHIYSLYNITGKVDEGEFSFLNKNRDLVTWQFGSAPFGLIDGKRTIISSAMDITELKNKESILRQQSKLASMGEMIANIAHQWRQPLSVISTISTGYKLKKEYGMEINIDDLVEDMENINENAQYLSKTIDDFRNYIRGNTEVQKFNLEERTKQFLQLVESSIKKHNLNISLNTDKNIYITGFPNELIQCFINIFNNAKDAFEESDKDNKYIFITQYQENDNVIIKFKDNAGGISDEALPKIFEPYFTTKHKSQGTGIGLSMTYNFVVKGMKGQLEVENKEFIYNNSTYKGAEFSICLPVLYEKENNL